jgi:cell wall-associated NlpC family hydrolase
MPLPRHFKRLTVASASIAALACGIAISSSSADLQTQIQAGKSAAASLQDQISSETSQIESTAGGVAAAKEKLATVQAELAEHATQLQDVQTRVMQARDHLLQLETRLHLASNDLAANLRNSYENGSPSVVDAILNAHGFANLLDQVNYIKRAQQQDANIVSFTQHARINVLHEAASLGKLELKDRDLTNQILGQRNQVAAIEIGLAKQQLAEENQRSNSQAKLSNVNSKTQALQAKLQHEQELEAQAQAALEAKEKAAEAQAQESSTEVNQQVGGLAINTSAMVEPSSGAPAAISDMIAAANSIATLPYIWGGGHGSFISPGYDCSGSVSFVLNAAGLLSSPETSGEFESYGDPGPGRWVTIYATAGHVWMDIDGRRFDTVALAEDGTRWSDGGGEFSGFVVRHPPGL